MEIIRIEITDEVMVRINRYMPVHVSRDRVPNCFSDSWSLSGLCNPFRELPPPSEVYPDPRLCDLHKPCSVYCMEGLGVKNAAELLPVKYAKMNEDGSISEDKEKERPFFNLCEEKIGENTPDIQKTALKPTSTLSETSAPATPSPEPVGAPPPVEAPPLAPKAPPVEQPAQASPQVGRVVEFQCEKCLSRFKVDPKAFDGVMLCPEHRDDPRKLAEPAPVEAPPQPAAAIDNPPKELDPATTMGKNIRTSPEPVEEDIKLMPPRTGVQAIPFRKSSAAWQIWILLLEPLSEEELDAKIKDGKNYYYFKKFVPKVLEAAREKGVLEEKDDKYQIIGKWDTIPGRRKKSGTPAS